MTNNRNDHSILNDMIIRKRTESKALNVPHCHAVCTFPVLFKSYDQC
jgi:hypothetical protein